VRQLPVVCALPRSFALTKVPCHGRSCAGPKERIAGAASGSPIIEMVIGAATLRILPGVDTATLTTVLRAMARTCM
jgi:hypothetical protein